MTELFMLMDIKPVCVGGEGVFLPARETCDKSKSDNYVAIMWMSPYPHMKWEGFPQKCCMLCKTLKQKSLSESCHISLRHGRVWCQAK